MAQSDEYYINIKHARELVKRDDVRSFKERDYHNNYNVWMFTYELVFTSSICEMYDLFVATQGLPEKDALVDVIIKLGTTHTDNIGYLGYDKTIPISIRQLNKERLERLIKHAMFTRDPLNGDQLRRILTELNFQPPELVMHYFDYRVDEGHCNGRYDFDVELLHHSAITNVPSYAKLASKLDYLQEDIIQACLTRLKIHDTLDLKIVIKNVPACFFSDEEHLDLARAFFRAIFERKIVWNKSDNYYCKLILQNMIRDNSPFLGEFVELQNDTFDIQVVDRIWGDVVKSDLDNIFPTIFKSVPTERHVSYLKPIFSDFNKIQPKCPRIQQLFVGKDCKISLSDAVILELANVLPLDSAARFCSSIPFSITSPAVAAELHRPQSSPCSDFVLPTKLVQSRIDKKIAKLTRMRNNLDVF